MKKEYSAPKLVDYGKVEDITAGFVGQYSDWMQGDPNPPGMCNPEVFDNCPTGS